MTTENISGDDFNNKGEKCTIKFRLKIPITEAHEEAGKKKE